VRHVLTVGRQWDCKGGRNMRRTKTTALYTWSSIAHLQDTANTKLQHTLDYEPPQRHYYTNKAKTHQSHAATNNAPVYNAKEHEQTQYYSSI